MGTEPEPAGTADGPRADVAFLANSWNRLDVLEAAATEPRDRDELMEHTGVSRVTLSRILADLESRGWIERGDAGYVATSAGRLVAEELGTTLSNLATLESFGEDAEWLPLDAFDFDLRHLRDAEVISPTWDDISVQVTELVDLVYESTAIRGIGTGVDREFFNALADATLNGSLSLELILTPPVIDAVTDDDELCRLFRDLADAEDASIYRHRGGTTPTMLGIHEMDGSQRDVLEICGEHAEGAPPGTVRTEEPAVLDWAQAYFAERRAESHELRAPVFTP